MFREQTGALLKGQDLGDAGSVSDALRNVVKVSINGSQIPKEH